MRRPFVVVLADILSAASWAVAADLASRAAPADGDPAIFRAPITIYFNGPIELDSSGDGRFTAVKSTGIEVSDFEVPAAGTFSTVRHRGGLAARRRGDRRNRATGR